MAQKNKGIFWRKYNSQRLQAKQRGIPWRMTFEEWCSIWHESGKWAERGRRHGQYVMARFGDRGAYEPGNVRICLVGENVVENTSRLPARGFCAPGFQQSMSPEKRALRIQKISASLIGNQYGAKPKPSISEKFRGRRRVFRDGRATWAYPQDADYPRAAI